MEDPIDSPGLLPPEVARYYAAGSEAGRLASGAGQLELARTQELLTRYLPAPPAAICDVGGGPGIYACWLAGLGYAVHLVDPMPLHVEQARQTSLLQSDTPLASAVVGDARHLERQDASVDAVLLFGPLYHLPAREDRIAALREAGRIVRPGGPVLAVGISRFASVLDGLTKGLFADPSFMDIALRDVTEGQHRNPADHPGYFTTAYLHHPDELRAEVEDAGLRYETTVAIEGPAWLSSWVQQQWHNLEHRERILTILRRIEQEPSLLGASAHLLVVARA